jgi:hypothetical protein
MALSNSVFPIHLAQTFTALTSTDVSIAAQQLDRLGQRA